MGDKENISYQKSWHIQVSGLKLIDFSTDRKILITLDKSNYLRLFDQNGKELWHRPAGYELVSLSLADTLEVLGVDKDKHSILYGPEGATLWRKRPFPALNGKISASGEAFSFVTSDPAIVGADRTLRVKWAYRNLLKRPMDIALSATGQTTAFPCSDDCGDGFNAVNKTGRPFEPFKGMKTVKAVDVSEDGQIIMALDNAGSLFCVNVVHGYGIWKGKSSPRDTGVSFASVTGDAIVYSEQGRIKLFDAKGNKIWEYNFSERLLAAFICPDSKAIYYATERGEIGCLRKSSENAENAMEFMEKKVAQQDAAQKFFFRKVWRVELSGSRESPPVSCSWTGHEGVEYFLVWNGKDCLMCLNDVGEEVWQRRIGETKVLDISASVDADSILILTTSGVIGFDIDGNEAFRFFGTYKLGHVFAESSLLLVDEKFKARFYMSPEHFSHVIESEEKVKEICPIKDDLILAREKSIAIIDFYGNIKGEKEFESEITNVKVAEDKRHIAVGLKSGALYLFDARLKEKFKYSLEGPVKFADFAHEYNDVFAAIDDNEEIVILRRRSNELLKIALTGKPEISIKTGEAMVVGTDLDQLGLINCSGELLGRYTCPDRLVALLRCKRQGCFMVLTDDAFGCIGVVKDTRGPDRRPD